MPLAGKAGAGRGGMTGGAFRDTSGRGRLGGSGGGLRDVRSLESGRVKVAEAERDAECKISPCSFSLLMALPELTTIPPTFVIFIRSQFLQRES